MAGGEAVLERLTHPEVADFLIRGARFIKWDEVRGSAFHSVYFYARVTLYKRINRFDLYFSLRMKVL